MIPLQLKLAAAGIAAAVVFAGGVKLGLWWNADDLAECEATVSEIERVSDALAKENERIRLASEQVTRDVSASWSAALDWQRANPRIVRVRENCSGASGMPAVSIPASGLNAGTAHGGLGAVLDAAQCEARLNDAVVDVAQLLHLQHWIRQQGEIGK